MAEGHGDPIKDEAAFEALPEDVKDEIRADVSLLRSNLPPGELPEEQPVGIGATSEGFLVVRAGHAAYQLTADGATIKVSGSAEGLLLTTYKDGRVVEGPRKA